MDDDVSEALREFVVDNSDLERLKALLNQFNIFEAIGAVRQELRHSDFLSYLLDPRQNHGLGDAFLKKFLQSALPPRPDARLPLTAIDVDTWDLDLIEIIREWQSIDILLRDRDHRLVVAIENKIDTREHSAQLQRYWGTLCRHFSEWKRVCLYLTPEGERPSCDDFLPMDYGSIATLLENLIDAGIPTLGKDIQTLLIHYTQMLRRHIVGQSEIAGLCRRIYHKHKRALDTIFEYRPDQQQSIREFLETLIGSTEGLILDHSSKSYVQFAPAEWELPRLKSGQGWTASGRVLLFEFQNRLDSLKLKLIIGPGPEETRKKLFQVALDAQGPFKTTQKNLGKKWNEIFHRTFLSSKSYLDLTEEKIEGEIREHWERFHKLDLPEISKAIRTACAD